MMEQRKYWQSFGERSDSEGFNKSSENEFSSDLPLELAGAGGLTAEQQSLFDAKTPRRDFLKYLGFSTAAAALAASCEVPVNHVIPYVNKPDNMIPGVADYYATTFVLGGDIIPIVAKVRDGRPIKLEGNELSKITEGGTSSRVQAAVLDLYDTGRLRYPVQILNGIPQEVSTFEAFDQLVQTAMAAAGQLPLALVTPTITSPTTLAIIAAFLAKMPGSRHVQYDVDSYSALLLANEACYGKRSIPSYHFERAKTIVSLGADFLGTWLSPVEFARNYVRGRKIDEKQPAMSRHYQFESLLSLTGANADYRYTHRPSQTGQIALALLAAVGGPVSAPSLDAVLKAAVSKAAKDLMDNKGKALVICGSQRTEVQIVVNAINEAIGASGTTVDWSTPVQWRQGIDSDMKALVDDMDGGKIGGLLVYGVNPAYCYFESDKFRAALKKLPLSISFNDRLDETTELCKLAIPAPHFLESWGDTEAKPGYYSMLQPTIAPLFKTRPFEDSLLKWSGNPVVYQEYFKQFWISKLGGMEAYEKALQDGVVQPASGGLTSYQPLGANGIPAGKLAEAAAAIPSGKPNTMELVLYQSMSMGTGLQGNNPWLLELPDPMTKANWDNYAVVSPKFAKDVWKIDLNDQRQADKFEVHPERQVIRLKLGTREISIPAVVVPGTQPDTIGLAVGFGRQSEKPENTASYIGRAADGAGKNAFPFARYNGKTFEWSAPGLSFESTSETYQIAQTQTHSTYQGRTEVVKEFTLAHFLNKPEEIREEREEELKPYGGLKDFESQGTLYPVFDKPGIKWGMSVDMNSCIGCGACVVACHAENNVPVVGKREVIFWHDMHWIRIDRYFTGNLDDADSIQTVFQPMLCQHCDNAPCENVCPVSATNHSSEGLNQMIYNRCIGTKYCANNCPFKVRRFNWADYNGADSFPNNQQEDSHLGPAVHMMNDDLSRMVLNPDVTIRARGVMEKCTFCVQRLQEGKLKAKKENRPLKDMSDARTACQQACPTEAIVFGNVNDKDSRISQTRADNGLRLFYALEELHILPNVNYLAKLRNNDLPIGDNSEVDQKPS
jgi:MoCo/4Fe-4S cofactor protein with predicted Tat translocation signal